MSLVAAKLHELYPYLRSVAFKRNVPYPFVEDIVQSTLVRLLDEGEFDSAFMLWGKATNVLREEAAKSSAASLPLSGVGFQAAYYARKYLMQNDFDPQYAYYNQTESPRVSMALLQLVAGGSASIDSVNMSQVVLSRDNSSDEVSSRVAELLQSLPEQMRKVVELKVGVYSNSMTTKEVAAELAMSSPDVRKLWNDAKSELRCSIEMGDG